MNLKDALRGKLTDREFDLLKTSFDIVGDIAILEIPEELKKKEKMIAQAVLDVHKNIKTVCRKVGGRSGIYRLRKVKKILGNGTETMHKESGFRFKLDIKKAYFSVRESTERLRVSSDIKPDENILVAFSGIGPFGIMIAKRNSTCKVVMVEINPKACEYAEENIRLNKVQANTKNICSDIKKVELGRFDRIFTPLPEKACKYLDTLLKFSKKGTIIYLYGICPEVDKKIDYSDLLEEINKRSKGKVKILNKRKVLPYATRMYKVCIELEVV